MLYSIEHFLLHSCKETEDEARLYGGRYALLGIVMVLDPVSERDAPIARYRSNSRTYTLYSVVSERTGPSLMVSSAVVF